MNNVTSLGYCCEYITTVKLNTYSWSQVCKCEQTKLHQRRRWPQGI